MEGTDAGPAENSSLMAHVFFLRERPVAKNSDGEMW